MAPKRSSEGESSKEKKSKTEGPVLDGLTASTFLESVGDILVNIQPGEEVAPELELLMTPTKFGGAGGFGWKSGGKVLKIPVHHDGILTDCKVTLTLNFVVQNSKKAEKHEGEEEEKPKKSKKAKKGDAEETSKKKGKKAKEVEVVTIEDEEEEDEEEEGEE